MGRSLIWITYYQAQGWGCSQCEWMYPIPSLLSGSEAKDAYDRLANTKFKDHDCTKHPRSTPTGHDYTFMKRMQELVTRGFKPKDAAELVLQEVMLEHRNNSEILKKARSDADEFLRMIREGRL